jgi:hypothetical protein
MYGKRGVWAIVQASAALDAVILKKQKFRRTPLGFRIAAPDAGKGTALEKNGRADAGAVVQAEMLNIENYAALRHGSRMNMILGESGRG